MRKLALAALTLWLTSTGCKGGDADLPEAYSRLAVPEARLQSAEARESGRILFISHCALCHGARGDGRGVRASGFARPPADFTDPSWRREARPRRVYHAIREGLRGTQMPAWKNLSEGESWDLVAYVLSIRSGEAAR